MWLGDFQGRAYYKTVLTFEYVYIFIYPKKKSMVDIIIHI